MDRTMRLLVGFVGALVTIALAGFVTAWTGVVNVSASEQNELLDRFLGYASGRSLARHAEELTNPFAKDSAAIAEGLFLYRKNCLVCHAAPGLKRADFAAGLNPPAPSLTLKRTQSKSDGQLLWVLSNGIRMTGMPAFSSTLEKNDLWKIVSFVRHLDQLADDELKKLGATRPETKGR